MMVLHFCDCRSYAAAPVGAAPAPNPLMVLHALAGGKCVGNQHLKTLMAV